MNRNHNQRIAATYNFLEHPAFLAAVFGGFHGALVWFMVTRYDPAPQPELTPFFYLFCAASLIAALFQIIKWSLPVYFTEAGLEFCFLGHCFASLSWDHVSQVGIRNPDRTKISHGKRYLEITTAYYPAFTFINGFFTGLVQKVFFDVIRLDPTRKNMETVRHFYGDLDYEMK